MPTNNEENRARVLVAAAAKAQLETAAKLLRNAAANLEALRFGIAPALENAKKAIAAVETAQHQTDEVIRRIP